MCYNIIILKRNEVQNEEIKKWREKFSSQSHSKREKAEICLQIHRKWAINNSIIATPTILLNGTKVPSEIQVEDLKFFLLRQIESY